MIAVTGVVCAGGLLAWWAGSDPEPERDESAVPVASGPATPEPPAPGEPAARPAAAQGQVQALRGKVVDALGAPVRGAHVRAVPRLDALAADLECAKTLNVAYLIAHSPIVSCGCSTNSAQLLRALAELPAPAAVAEADTDETGAFTLQVNDPTKLLLHARAGELRASSFARDGEVLKLSPLVELKGTVVDRAGAGIAGAQVWIIDDGVTKLTSGADGSFTSLQSRAGKLLVAFKDGLLPDLKVGVPGQEAPPMFGPHFGGGALQLQLAPPITLRGRVEYRGAGVAGVEVQQRMSPCAAKATTDARGNFEMTDMREQAYHLVARSGTRAGEASPRSSAPPIVIELTDQVVVRGTVRDANGDPTRQAMVKLIPAGDEHDAARATAFSNEAGGYEAGPVFPGSYTLAVEAKGWRTHRQPLALDLKVPDVTVDVVLEAGSRLRGRVIDERGQPVAQAWVEVHEGTSVDRFNPRTVVRRETTDARGAFSAEGLADGPHTLVVHHGATREKQQQVTVPDDSVEVRLTRDARIVGSVTTASGGPATAARAEARLRVNAAGEKVVGHRSWGGQRTPGGYEIAGLDVGEYELEVGDGERSVKRQVKVSASEELRVDVVLPDARSISGVVQDELGRPVEGAGVGAGRRSYNLDFRMKAGPAGGADPGYVLTGADGRFTVGGLGEDPVAVGAAKVGYRPARLDKALPNGDPVVLRLVRTGLVTGRVLGDGQPLPRFRIASQEVRSPDGRFEIDRGAGAKLVLFVQAEGWAPLQRTVELPPQGSVDVGDLRLERGRSVKGRVLDERGEPIDRADVRAKGSGTGGYATTDPAGRFGLDTLPEGPVELEVSAKGFRAAKAMVAPGQSAVDLTLARGLTVSGRVIDEDGQPMRGLAFWLRGAAADPTSSGVDVDGEGAFEVRGLLPGELTLEPREREFGVRPRYVPRTTVQVTGPATQVVVVRGQSRGARVAVTTGGRGFDLSLRVSGEPTPRRAVREDGVPTFFAVPRGRHTLVVSAGRDVRQLPVDVGAEDLTVRLDEGAEAE